MQFGLRGTISTLEKAVVGAFFVFRLRGARALGMKISSDELDDPRQILMFDVADSAHPPRIFDSEQNPNPTFVYSLPASLLIEPLPDDLREGVLNPTVGSIYVTSAGTFVCVHDTERHDFDPVLINLDSGSILQGRLKHETAVFSKWRIAVKEGDESITLFSMPLPATTAQIG